jgi:hypothetical protein
VLNEERVLAARQSRRIGSAVHRFGVPASILTRCRDHAAKHCDGEKNVWIAPSDGTAVFACGSPEIAAEFQNPLESRPPAHLCFSPELRG